jgi:hypothetical protein
MAFEGSTHRRQALFSDASSSTLEAAPLKPEARERPQPGTRRSQGPVAAGPKQRPPPPGPRQARPRPPPPGPLAATLAPRAAWRILWRATRGPGRLSRGPGGRSQMFRGAVLGPSRWPAPAPHPLAALGATYQVRRPPAGPRRLRAALHLANVDVCTSRSRIDRGPNLNRLSRRSPKRRDREASPVASALVYISRGWTPRRRRAHSCRARGPAAKGGVNDVILSTVCRGGS